MTRRAPAPLTALTVSLVLLGGTAAAARAQAPGAADARAAGLAGNFLTLADGPAAALWNPAGLAARGAPRWSVSVPSLRASAGAGPVGLTSWLGGGSPSADERGAWLRAIEADAGQWARAQMEVTAIGASYGPLALLLTTRLGAEAWLPPDAARLGLFGNGGGPGADSVFGLAGSDLRAHAVTTAAVGYGVRVPMGVPGELSVGAALNVHVGHYLAAMTDNGSVLLEEPRWIHLRLPLLQIGAPEATSHPAVGWGVNVGATWQRGPVTVAAVMRDLGPALRWDTDAAVVRPFAIEISEDERTSDLEEGPLAAAPPEVRAWATGVLDGARPSPNGSLGVSLAPSPRLTLHATLHHRTRAAFQEPHGTSAGMGAEAMLGRSVSVTSGFAATPGGVRVGSGVTLRHRALRATLAVDTRRTERRWVPGLSVSWALVRAQGEGP